GYSCVDFEWHRARRLRDKGEDRGGQRSLRARRARSVKFSICHFPRSWDEEDDGRIIDAVIEHSLEADSLGFDGVFFPEHHFHGYSPTGSDPFMTAAYLAPQLKQAWLGFAVVV